MLLEVELTGLATRFGVHEGDVEGVVQELVNVPAIHLMGLMTIAPFSEDPEDARATFTRLRHVRDHMEHATGWALPELSMGMSNDFEVAIEEGATMVRVGPGNLRRASGVGSSGSSAANDLPVSLR